MVNSPSSANSFDHPTNMANPLSSTDPSASFRQNHQSHKNRKQSHHSKALVCDRYRSAAIDVVILIAVIGASGFLLFAYIKQLSHGIAQISGLTISVVKDEVYRAPMVYACLGLSILFATVAACGISKCVNRKCRNPNCRGLRKAVEFDIQLEEDCINNSSSPLMKYTGGKGLIELNEDQLRELEAELKKIAPTNGKAVMEFRARCGCSAGRMEVPGPKKFKKPKK